MALKEENRQCLICDNLIPPGDDAVAINSSKLFKVPGDKRIIHIACAKKVSDALEDWGEEDVDDDVDD